MGVDDRIATQMISWQENTLRFCQIRPISGGMIQVRPEKKTHMGKPLWKGKNMYKSPIFAGVPAVSL